MSWQVRQEAGTKSVPLGIEEIEGDDVVEHPSQQPVFGGVFEELFLDQVEVVTFADIAAIDHVAGGVEGDEFPRLQQTGGDLGIDDRRHPEFPGDRRHMAGGGADVGDDAAGLVHDGGVARRGMANQQDAAVGEAVEVVVAVDQDDPAGSDPALDNGAATGENDFGLRFVGRLNDGPGRGGAPAGKGPDLEDVEGIGGGEGPFDLQRPLEETFEGHCRFRQPLELAVVQGRQVLPVGRHVLP